MCTVTTRRSGRRLPVLAVRGGGGGGALWHRLPVLLTSALSQSGAVAQSASAHDMRSVRKGALGMG